MEITISINADVMNIIFYVIMIFGVSCTMGDCYGEKGFSLKVLKVSRAIRYLIVMVMGILSFSYEDVFNIQEMGIEGLFLVFNHLTTIFLLWATWVIGDTISYIGKLYNRYQQKQVKA